MTLLGYLRRFPVRHPFIFGVGVSTFKTGSVDVLVQRYVEDKEQIDWRRAGVFTMFGFCFCGTWQYFLFVKLLPKICVGASAFAAKPLREKLADRRGMRNLLIQNFAENGVNNPLIYFPVFYSIQAFLDGEEQFRIYQQYGACGSRLR
eukprot:g67444.t1